MMQSIRSLVVEIHNKGLLKTSTFKRIIFCLFLDLTFQLEEMANKLLSLILVLFLVITLASTLVECKPKFRGRGGIAGQALHDITRAIGGRGRGLDLGGLREILGKQITF